MSGRCTICQETFDPTEIAALKCGHTFHLHCISQWLQTSTSCPVCRRTAKRASDIIEQLFFDCGEDSMVSNTQSPYSSSKRISELSKKVQLLETELSSTAKLAKTHEQNATKAEKDVHSLRMRNRDMDAALKTLRTEMTLLDGVKEKNDALTVKNKRLELELKKLRAIDLLVRDNENADLGGHLDDCSANVLKTALGITKKKLNDLTAEKQAISQRNRVLDRENAALKKEKDELYVMLQTAREEIKNLKAGRQRSSTPHKSNRYSDAIIALPPSPMPDFDDQSLDDTEDICAAFNMPMVKTTNMAARANLVPKSFQIGDNGDSESDADVAPQIRRKRPAPNAGKSTVTSGKRFDGFGGRALVFEKATKTKRASPTSPPRPQKRIGKTIAKSKSKAARVLTPKIRNCLMDDSIVVLSD